MKLMRQACVGLLACSTVMAAAELQAGDNGAAGRKILEANQNAVIKVKVVSQQKVSVNGRNVRDSELKGEVTGMVIDPSGLVAVSLMAVDPSKAMERMMGAASSEMKIDSKTTLKELKLVLPDDSEIEAKVVLRDEDWDLAFLRPLVKPAKPLAALDLSQTAKPQVFDEVVALGRKGKVASHVPAVYASRINAIVAKPRVFYIPQGTGEEGMEALGMPVFTLEGKLIGMTAVRLAPGGEAQGMMGMMSGGGGEGIILPAADILEASKQAGEAAPIATETETK